MTQQAPRVVVDGGGGCGGACSECDHNEDVVGLYCAQYTATPYLIYDIMLYVNCEYCCCRVSIQYD